MTLFTSAQLIDIVTRNKQNVVFRCKIFLSEKFLAENDKPKIIILLRNVNLVKN